MDRLPHHDCERIHAGESPVLVWREYRGLELAELASRSGLTVDYLAGVEAKTKHPRDSVLQWIADALEVPVIELKAASFGGCSLALQMAPEDG